jgi:hypothetical protein
MLVAHCSSRAYVPARRMISAVLAPVAADHVATKEQFLFQTVDADYVRRIKTLGRWTNLQGITFRVTSVNKGQGDPQCPQRDQWVVRGVPEPDNGEVAS